MHAYLYSLSAAPHALPHADGVGFSSAPQADGAGFSSVPHADGAGLSDDPHAEPHAEIACSVPNKFFNAILYLQKMNYIDFIKKILVF